MKEIIIKKKRNYFKPISALILIFWALYFAIFKFLLYPAEHTYFLLRTKEIVIIFSIVGTIACLLGIFIIIKSIFRKNAFLKVDKQGIYDGFSFYNNKFIKWEEISRIETIRHNYNSYIAIFTKRALNKEKGISYFLYKINKLSMGTPYIISSGYLDCSFSELEKIVNEAFLEYKKSNM